MSIINLMDQILSNKIAAGEVVEKVSSVVKELVENSIDASSKNIKIELIKSGTKLIKVIDDGIGMDKKDAELCFSRHATSKIKNEDDLYFINTLGFRGEALASIASVSNITLNTSNLEESTFVKINGGKIESITKGDERKGTIIEVSNLFYNTPARLKFLKSLNTELYNVISFVEKVSLSNPNISFCLISDGKQILKTTGSNDLLKTIHEIYGSNVSKNMISIDGENNDYQIKGYVSNINIYKSSRTQMNVFVNNRIIKNAFINRIIKDAYHTFLAENKYPIVVLNILTDPTLIDVNIHPTKQDIKISKPDELEELLFSLIRNKLNQTDNTIKAINYEEDSFEFNYKNEEVSDQILLKVEEKEEAFNLNFDFKEENQEEMIYPVGLVMGTYLICQKQEEMFIIDIHAANERINYEIYLNALKNEKTNRIEILIPIVIEYTEEEAQIINSKLENIKKIGIIIETFGTNCFRIIEHPTWLLQGYEEESIRKILDLIIEVDKDFDRVKFNERLAINLACKMSVKANSNISLIEQEELIKRLFKTEFPYTCPHGRPTIIKYEKYELEKLFKRVN